MLIPNASWWWGRWHWKRLEKSELWNIRMCRYMRCIAWVQVYCGFMEIGYFKISSNVFKRWPLKWITRNLTKNVHSNQIRLTFLLSNVWQYWKTLIFLLETCVLFITSTSDVFTFSYILYRTDFCLKWYDLIKNNLIELTIVVLQRMYVLVNCSAAISIYKTDDSSLKVKSIFTNHEFRSYIYLWGHLLLSQKVAVNCHFLNLLHY